MNLRILKKLSKRAAPYLPLLGDRREQFRAEAGENYHSELVRARKHFERCPSVHTDLIQEGELCIAPRSRRDHVWPYIKLYPPHHPWPGTIMVGAMSGYYEPEWDEETAYSSLRSIVAVEFTDWEAMALEREPDPRLERSFRLPRDVFAAADELIARQRSDGAFA